MGDGSRGHGGARAAVGARAVHEAARHGNEESVKNLIQSKVDVNARMYEGAVSKRVRGVGTHARINLRSCDGAL